MKVPTFVSGLIIALFPMIAHAEASQQEISYEEAVAKCAEFVNDPQLVEIEFKVSCFDESIEWRETDKVMIQNDNTGSLGHRILMKEKWFTPDFAIPVVIDASQSECPVLSQFRTARQAELTLTCEEFVKQYSDPEALASRCSEVLVDATPQTEPTGHQINPCGATSDRL